MFPGRNLAAEEIAVEPQDGSRTVVDGGLPTGMVALGDDEHLGARALGMTPVLMTRHLARYAPEVIPQMAPRCDYVVGSVGEVVGLVKSA